MAGLTPEGLEIRRLEDEVAALQDKATEIYQDQVPEGEVVNVEENSALGRAIGVVAPSHADFWEALEEVYNAFIPHAATGVALDNLVAIGGVTRREQTATRANVILEGTINTLIDTTSRVSSPTTGKTFAVVSPVGLTSTQASGIRIILNSVVDSTDYTISYESSLDVLPTPITVNSGVGATTNSILTLFLNEITLNHTLLEPVIDGTSLVISNSDPFQLLDFTTSSNVGITKVKKTALVVCTEAGPIDQPANTITGIATPVFGWDSVTNPSQASTGNNRETDEELRERFRNTKFERATNTIESLYSAIFALDGVEDFVIYENDTNITDGNGVPGHSFLPIVEGGLGSEIAQAIWDNKPIGILSVGDSTVTVIDSRGFPHDVSFSRPDAVNLYIEISLTTNSQFPGDGEDQIRANLINYIETLAIGEDVVYSRLYTPINNVAGHQVDSLFIGTAPSPSGTSNVVIPFDGVARLLSTNITFV